MNLCVTTIARNEAHYLLEWIAYQRVNGASHIMIYNNRHEASHRSLLERLYVDSTIRLNMWQGRYPHGPQVTDYDNALKRLRGSTAWVLYIAVDEFLVPLRIEQLSKIFSVVSGFEGVRIRWLLRGSSGEQWYLPDPVIKRFQLRQHADETTVMSLKSVIRPEQARATLLHVHRLDGPEYRILLGEREYLIPSAGTPRSDQLARRIDAVRVHHNRTKSANQYRAKEATGRADCGYSDREPYPVFDENEVEVPSAHRSLLTLNEETPRLRRLLDRS